MHMHFVFAILTFELIFSAGKKDDINNPSEKQNAVSYDGFSETQTDSQVQLLHNPTAFVSFALAKYWVLMPCISSH